MSFRAPRYQRKRSRLSVSWRILSDPPQLSRRLSVGFCVVNVVLPGIGTMITGMITDKIETFLVGALQLMSTVFVLGWVWSVAWGVELVRRSARRGIGTDTRGLTDEGGGGANDAGWGAGAGAVPRGVHVKAEEGRRATSTVQPDTV